MDLGSNPGDVTLVSGPCGCPGPNKQMTSQHKRRPFLLWCPDQQTAQSLMGPFVYLALGWRPQDSNPSPRLKDDKVALLVPSALVAFTSNAQSFTPNAADQGQTNKWRLNNNNIIIINKKFNNRYIRLLIIGVLENFSYPFYLFLKFF